jgi:hypothetical protein
MTLPCLASSTLKTSTLLATSVPVTLLLVLDALLVAFVMPLVLAWIERQVS